MSDVELLVNDPGWPDMRGQIQPSESMHASLFLTPPLARVRCGDLHDGGNLLSDSIL